MLELDRQLDRIRLRCKSLVNSTKGTAGTIPSADTVSSTPSIRSASTLPRRAVVPRMGIRRRPFEDQRVPVPEPRVVERTSPVTSRDNIPTTSNYCSNNYAAFTSQQCCDNENLSYKDRLEDIEVMGLTKPETASHVTKPVNREGASTLPCNSSKRLDPIAGTQTKVSDDTTHVVDSRDNILAPNQLSRNLASSGARYLERNQRPSKVDNPRNNNLTKDMNYMYSPANDKWDMVDNTGKTNLTSSWNKTPNSQSHYHLKSLTSAVRNLAKVHDLGNLDYSPVNNARVDTTGKTELTSFSNKLPSTSPYELKSSTNSAAKSMDCVSNVHEVGDLVDYKSVGSRATVLGGVNRSSQTDEVDADRQQRSRRHELYWRYADVMYTNPDNLDHTIAVQQALFRQQLDDHGHEPRQALPTVDRTASGRADPATEWVVKRRSDGSRYITRRPARFPRGWRAERRLAAEERRRRRRIETTTDDGRSAEPHWTRDDHRRQVIDPL